MNILSSIKTRISARWAMFLAFMNAFLTGKATRDTVRQYARAYQSGQVDIADVIIMCVAFLVASYILPQGITAVFNVDTTTWDPVIQTIWRVLFPLLGVLAVALYFFYAIKKPS